jgi:hypothetical protein
VKRVKVIYGTKWAWQKYATEAAFKGSGPKLGFELAPIAQYCGNQFGGGELRCETSLGKVDRSTSSSWAAEGLETGTRCWLLLEKKALILWFAKVLRKSN